MAYVGRICLLSLWNRRGVVYFYERGGRNRMSLKMFEKQDRSDRG